MSSPYAPPTARIGEAELLAGYDGTGTFSIGRCVRDAWSSVLRNFGPFLGVGALSSLVGLVVFGLFGLLVTISPLIALASMALLYVVLTPIFAWGLLRFSLSAIDGRARVGELFSIFERFWRRLAKIALIYLVALIVSLPGSLPQALAQGSERRWLVALTWVWLLVWSAAVSTRFSLAFYFVVDRELPVLDALRSSWAWTRGNVLRFVGLFAVALGLVLAGLLVFGIGLIPAALVIFQMWPSAFRQIVGRPGPATGASVA